MIGVDDEGEEITITASVWIDKNQPVEMMTWAPGMPMIIADRLIAEGGWIERKGVSCFNLYRPPTIKLGDAGKAGPWVDLVRKVYPTDADHIIKWFASRVQHPEIKINHGLVLGSNEQGIGKDTILEGVKRAVGPWNFKEIAPKNIFDSFNPWKRAVILRVSEAKDMGDVSRFELYDGMKTLLAAPPDVLECNEKNIKQHYVLNCMGVDHHHQPSDRRHLPARRGSPALRGVVRLRAGRFRPRLLERDVGVVRRRRRLPCGGVPGRRSTSRTSIRRRRRRRRRHSGASSTPTAQPRKASCRTSSTELGNPDAVTISQMIEAAPPDVGGSIRCGNGSGAQEPQGVQPPARKLRLPCGAQFNRQGRVLEDR